MLFSRPLYPSTRSLLAVVTGAALWSIGYFLEFISPEYEAKLFWAKFQYLGICSIPLSWYSFAFQYMGGSGWSQRSIRQRLVLAALPAITMALAATNDLHLLIWDNVREEGVNAFQVLVFDHGWWFWLYLAYSYLLLMVGSARILRGMLVSYHSGPWRTVLRLLAVLIPWGGNLMYITGWSPIPYLDWSPLFFSISGLLFAISLFHFPAAELLPIAQRTVFAVQPDCLLVLDANHHLVDLNASARKMLADAATAWQGKPVGHIFPDLASWIPTGITADGYSAEITRGSSQDARYYDLRVVPLTTREPRTVGRLVVCHDITQYRRAQKQLEKAHAELEQAIEKRTADLRYTVDQLQAELTQRIAAEKRFSDVVEAAPDALLIVDRDGVVKLLNAQAERMFGYSREELLDKPIQLLVPEELRENLLSYVERYFSHSADGQVTPGLPFSALRKDGSSFPIEICLGTLKTSEGVWYTCNARDITERKRAEVEQARLLAAVRRSRQELRELTARMAEAQENEQRRIAADLHDRVGQSLTGLNLNLQVIKNLVSEDCSPTVRSRLDDSIDLVEETTREVRNLMAELTPPLLEEYGLGAALSLYCQKYTERTGIMVTFACDETFPRLPAREETALFRIVQEGLNNVLKHARATSAAVRLERVSGAAFVRVEDNGQGFNAKDMKRTGELPRLGLLNIEERAASIGGVLKIQSTPGSGTCLVVALPMGEPDDTSVSR